MLADTVQCLALLKVNHHLLIFNKDSNFLVYFLLCKEYPFLLDPFQKEALSCIENTQSVLVSAHTSAGKTVVAE